MDREIILTRDGSHSISIPEMNVTYHSIHGAIQESNHVFIEAGLQHVLKNDPPEIRIFEMGLGTGLNVLLTLLEAEKFNNNIKYTSLELFPINEADIDSLNYCDLIKRPDLKHVFKQIHQIDWNVEARLRPNFVFEKIKGDLKTIDLPDRYDLIYYDAFAPTAQPELWISEVFKKMINASNQQAVMVTYCSKSSVRKAMKDAGWTIEKIPGPHGKREMVRAMALTEAK